MILSWIISKDPNCSFLNLENIPGNMGRTPEYNTIRQGVKIREVNRNKHLWRDIRSDRSESVIGFI